MFENQNRYQANLSLALLDLLKNNKLEKIHPQMIAKKCKTISYEVLTSIGNRVYRNYE